MKNITKEWYIDAPWGKIALVSWGSANGDPVLLVHGRQDSAATFIPILEYLPEKYHYVGVDLPGHGKSDPFPIGVMLTRFHFLIAIDLAVRHLQWQHFTYIGHSMGCEQGLFYNAIYPQKITKFILFDPLPSLQRLQIHDHAEYYKSFYANYYDNYKSYNNDSRVYTKKKALDAVMRARGLTEEQAEVVLMRNLKKIGDDAYRLSTLALKTEKEWVFNMPWGKTEALSWGNPSDPPVLLCHGRLDACSSFRPLVRHLPPGRFYLSVELPGNGRSAHYPRGGGRLLITDYLPPLERVRDHFKWDKFTFIGHSMGVVLGKFFNCMFPGQIARMVDIEPVPAYLPISNDLHSWYQYNYSTFHGDDKYAVPALETAPKYSYEEARVRLMKTRRLTEEAADHVLERCLQPTEDGLYRFTLDQRFKSILLLPYLFDSLRDFYTAPKTPTLGIFATQCIATGIYDSFPFAMDDALWKHGNYRHVVMEGGHDIHLQKPEEVGRCITQFLNEDPE